MVLGRVVSACVIVWCGVVCCVVVCCVVVWCVVVVLVWCGVVLCCVVLCCVVLCCVVLCCVVLCCVVLYCIVPKALSKRQWPGCLPTGTGKREGCVSKCTRCVSVLLYSRDQCTVAVGRCCSADACARSHRVYWAQCTLCAVLHCLVLCTALHCVCHAALHCVRCTRRTSNTVPHRQGQWAAELLQCTATLPVGSGQLNSCNSPPHCLGAVGSGTPATHRHTTWRQLGVELLQCAAPLLASSGQWNSCNGPCA